MKNRKIVALLVLLCLTVPKITYADVNEDVANAQKMYQEYQDRADKMTGDIIKLSGIISTNMITIEENNTKIENLDKQIENSQIYIEKLKADIKEREELKAERVRQFYKTGGNISYINLLLNSSSLTEVITNVNNISKIMEVDRDIISDIEKDKQSLAEELVKQEDDRKAVVKLNEEVKETLKTVEEDKVEQEKLLADLKIEQEVFGKEVLEVAERELIKYQLEVINDSSDINALRGAVSQLQAIKDNQIQTEEVKTDIDSLVDKAKDEIDTLIQQNQAATYLPNRGNADATGDDIVNYAYQFLGKEYVWGAVGPEVFDCSGLTSYVYRQAAGMEISRTTYTQINVGIAVAQEDLQPGDLVFTYDNEHVGIYVGGGNYINATYPGSTVRVTPVTNFYAARRYL